jgi:hypothetical protein
MLVFLIGILVKNNQKTTQSWVGEGENLKTVVRRQQIEPKTMFCIFLKPQGQS